MIFAILTLAILPFVESITPARRTSIRVDSNHPGGDYRVVYLPSEEILLEGDGFSVFANGRWYAHMGGGEGYIASAEGWNRDNYNKLYEPLYLQDSSRIAGEDEVLGRYEGTAWTWSSASPPSLSSSSSSSSVLVKTTWKNFHSGRHIVFETEFPVGANNTSPTLHANYSRDAVINHFPAFMKKSALLSGTLSWQGSFISPRIHDGASTGTQGGPTVYFNAAAGSTSDNNNSNNNNVVLTLSPWFGQYPGTRSSSISSSSGGTNKSSSPAGMDDDDKYPRGLEGGWKLFSGGNGNRFDGKAAVWAPGVSGGVDSIPPGFRQRLLLTLAPYQQGVTGAMYDWGETIRQGASSSSSSSSSSSRLASPPSSSVPPPQEKKEDLTVTKIGYQTDNGAAYCFCEGNCSETLLTVVKSLQAHGLNISYLSFQGSGASSGGRSAHDTAPWCVDTWGVDGGLGANYPMNMHDFSNALGIPLQLYAPYFCPDSQYFNGTKWEAVTSDVSLDGCDDFNFKDVSDTMAYDFYYDMFSRGKAVGMVSFEPDFMNQNINCVPQFVRTVDRATRWQKGMAKAAADLDVAIQWCYATPTDVLHSVELSSVTNFRVSSDFCYGQSWDIGVSSLLVAALGKHPSKDTLWSTDNDHLIVPGCDWTADHEKIAAELHVVLALFSTGPVGISDMVNMTDFSLLSRIVALDGTLLAPERPATSVDSTFMLPSPLKGGGYVYQSCGIEDRSHVFISFKMEEAFEVPWSDFYPRIDGIGGGRNASHVIYQHYGLSSRCENNTWAIRDGCVVLAEVSALPPSSSSTTTSSTTTTTTSSHVVLPKSSFANVTGGSDLRPIVTTVWTIDGGGDGWLLLGELSKYMSLSPRRFSEITTIATPAAVHIESRNNDSEGFTRSASASSGIRTYLSLAVRGTVGEHVRVTALKAVPAAAGSGEFSAPSSASVSTTSRKESLPASPPIDWKVVVKDVVIGPSGQDTVVFQ